MTAIDSRIDELYKAHQRSLHARTDVMFAVLMVLQFVAAVLAAWFISPRTWVGSQQWIHIHVWAALGLGLCLTAVSVALVMIKRGEPITRYTIATAQIMFSALLIHLSGGRIETHFHVFGSLAFLAIYRDWRVLVPATIVISVDHVVRGIFWPESVFGVFVASPWRAFEHAGWVLFEDVFLAVSCVQASREMREVAATHARLENSKAEIEKTVQQRTAALVRKTDALRRSEERYELAVRGSQNAIWDWNLQTNSVYYAPLWRELFCEAGDDLSDSPDEWLGRIASGSLAEFNKQLTALVDGEIEDLDLEIAMLDWRGTTYWMRCRAAAVRDATGRATRLAGSLSDLTDIRNLQEELRRLAQHDRLTGLPNRELFTDRVQRAIVRGQRYPNHIFAVLFFDFDRFKVVNDSLGHDVGDQLLQSIASRFKANLRESDTVARFGGDEFVVLLDGLTSQEDAARKAACLLDVFCQPHHLGSQEVVSTASIGLVLSDPRYNDAAAMIRDADAAMYRAKSDGKAQFRVFDTEMHASATRRLALERELRDAINTDQIKLAYQPIVSLSTGEMQGVEALVRWRHPTRGLIPPDDFIPLAEETGLIVALGEQVLREACMQIGRWKSALQDDLFVTVNVSKRQIVQADFLDVLGEVISETGIEPSRLKLEITESTIMDPRHDVVAIMEQVNDLGVRLAMDDFGTGHSSLSCLHSFPIDVLKIDKEFVRNMTRRTEFSAVMYAIITLASHLHLSVVAEGVETRDQLAQLQGMDCELGQGYLFSKPVPPEQIPVLASSFAGLPRVA